LCCCNFNFFIFFVQKKRSKTSFKNEKEPVENSVHKIDGVMTIAVGSEPDIENSEIEINQNISLFVGNVDDFR